MSENENITLIPPEEKKERKPKKKRVKHHDQVEVQLPSATDIPVEIPEQEAKKKKKFRSEKSQNLDTTPEDGDNPEAEKPNVRKRFAPMINVAPSRMSISDAPPLVTTKIEHKGRDTIRYVSRRKSATASEIDANVQDEKGRSDKRKSKVRDPQQPESEPETVDKSESQELEVEGPTASSESIGSKARTGLFGSIIKFFTRRKSEDEISDDWMSDEGEGEESKEDIVEDEDKKPKRLMRRMTKRVGYRMELIAIPLPIRLLMKVAYLWEWFTYLTTMVCFFFITYMSVFSYFDDTLFDFVFVLDLIFYFDTFLRIAVEIWRFKKKIPFIVFITPFTFLQYIGDMLSLFPFERFYAYWVGDHNLNKLQYYDFFRYNRFIRFWRCYNFLDTSLKEGRISEKFAFVLQYASMFLSFIHIVACALYLLLPMTSLDVILQRNYLHLNKYWMKDLDKKKPHYGITGWDHYVLSLDFSAAAVTTTGYGDLTPKLIAEMILIIFVMLIGAIVMTGLFTSGLTNFELNHDGARFDLFFRVEAIMDNLNYLGTTELFCRKVREYYDLLWNYREGVYDVEVLHHLPNSMKSDILYDICQEMFHKSRIFRDLEESFLRTIARAVKVVLYNPDMILCAKGGNAINMFYIIQGEVRVKSKYDPDKTAAILRAGCIIGEVSLMFSYPYTSTMETKTSCQLLLLQKVDFLTVLEAFPNMFEIVRQRLEDRFEDLRSMYEYVGQDPVKWVEYKGDYLPNGTRRRVDYPITMRKGTGFNAVVKDDIIDDSQGHLIVDMECLDPKYQKSHTLVYRTCLLPPILRCRIEWVQLWTKFTLIRTLYGAFIGPYCQVFRYTSDFEEGLCNFDQSLSEVRCLLNMFDVFAEVTNCVPVEGIYYKFTSGIRIKVSELGFWIDVISCLPVDSFQKNEGSGYIFYCASAFFRVLKLWKILRFFNYLDNQYPRRLFAFRVLHTVVVVLFATHFLACVLFAIACPDGLNRNGAPICDERSWLRSYEITYQTTTAPRSVEFDYLAEEFPYLISFYFACATLSTAGFGDFNPQTNGEILVLVFFQLVAFAISGYYTALLTSALSCIVRPKLLFQQKLVAIRQFMDHHGINEMLQNRVIEHYTLQDQLLGGVNLPRAAFHFMFDAPDYLLEDVLYQDVSLLFDGVPILTKIDTKLMVLLTKTMRRYLIPPGSIFLRKGEVRRQIYLVARGSVAVMDDNQDKPVRVLEGTGHFGLRDLLFGEPANHHIKTLSYCLLYEIDRTNLNVMLEEEPETDELIEQEKYRIQDQINEMTSRYSKYKVQVVERPKRIYSWIKFPRTKADNYPYCTFFEYHELFEHLKFAFAYKLLLMRRTVHPAGGFAKLWLSISSFLSCVTLATLMVESFMELRSPWFRCFQISLDFLNYLDIYIKMHWAYYDKRYVLICHPLRTMMYYVYDGTFFIDVLCCAPFELIVSILEWSHPFGYSPGAYWYTKLRWTRLGQVIRIPAIVHICHSIFKYRYAVLLGMYIALTTVLCSALTGLASHISCPNKPRIFQKDDEYRLPYCMQNSWVFKKTSLLDTAISRWIYGMYYVSQVIFGIGFADLLSISRSEVLLLVVMMIFGCILSICVLADITAAEVDVDENRAKYREEMRCLNIVMARENVHWRLVRSVRDHLKHNWVTSRGLQPRTLFYDLHPALEADLFREFVGDLLKRVPIFVNLSENIIRGICQYMKKLYFLKGERLMRIGNLEYEMFIIVEGKVWIQDEEGEWFATLGPGSSFGEAAMVYGLPRKFSAVASTLVEVFVLTSEDFQAVLESYPVLHDAMVSQIRNGQDDVFERIVQTKMKVKEEKYEIQKSYFTKQIEYILDLKDHPNLEDESEKDVHVDSRFHRYRKKLINFGRDDDDLAFIYFASKVRENFSLLLHPKCPFMNWFGFLIVWLSLITPGLASYEIAFSNESTRTPFDNQGIATAIQRITLYVEIPFYLNIIFNFLTPFIIFEGIYCKTHKGIAFNYVTDYTLFLFDIVSAFPVFLVLQSIPNEEDRDKWRLLYLVRFLRLIHFYRVQLKKKEDLLTSNFLFKIIISVSFFLLMAHSLACVFYWLSPCECAAACAANTVWTHDEILEMCAEGGWTRRFAQENDFTEIELMTPWRWYIRSLYWVVTTVSTTGFGDITPVNENETLVAIVAIFCGAFLLNVILSEFTSGAASLGKAHREFFYQVKLLSKYLCNIGLSSQRQYLLNAYFLMMWEGCRGVNYHKATDILPLTMKIEVCFSLYYEVAKLCKMFHGVKDKTFLRQVCVRFTHTMFLSGTNIVYAGEPGDRLYLVFKGEVYGYTHGTRGDIVIKKRYLPGQVFGRLTACFYDQYYTKNYRSEVHTEILSLSQFDILHLIKMFPEFKKQLQLYVIKKYDRRRDSQSIFQVRSARVGKYDSLTVVGLKRAEKDFEEELEEIDIDDEDEDDLQDEEQNHEKENKVGEVENKTEKVEGKTETEVAEPESEVPAPGPRKKSKKRKKDKKEKTDTSAEEQPAPSP